MERERVPVIRRDYLANAHAIHARHDFLPGARAALEAGSAFVLFDWMYHYVTDEQPMDLNSFLANFDAKERAPQMNSDERGERRGKR